MEERIIIKKYLTIKPRFLLLIALSISGFAALFFFDAQALAKADSQELNQLFGDMGVIKIVQALPVEIRLKDLNGRPVNLSDFRGKIVFLNFWATWCYDCRIEMPVMEKLHQKFKNKDFAIVTINLQ